jgi:hypothetical protein
VGNCILKFGINGDGTLNHRANFALLNLLTPNRANTAPSVSTVPGFILTGYIVGNRIQLIESQSDNLNGVTGGMALSQGANAGAFSMSSPSVAGVSYAFGAAGATVNGSGLLRLPARASGRIPRKCTPVGR